MKKILHFDWLRAVQVLGNIVPEKEIQCQKKKFSVQVSLDFKSLNFLTTHVYLACVCFSGFSVCYNYAVNTMWN